MKHLIFSVCFILLLLQSFANDFGGAICFTENLGQIKNQNGNPRLDVLFTSRTGNLSLQLKTDGFSYQLLKPLAFDSVLETTKIATHRVDVHWKGANKRVLFEGGDCHTGHANYFLSGEKIKNVKNYNEAVCKNLYNGIDIKFYVKDNEIHYDYIVAANEDYKQIRTVIKGANNVSINSNGELEIVTALGKITEDKPIGIQGNKIIEGDWVIKGSEISFYFKDYDSNESLIIDPPIKVWGTYFGGETNEGMHTQVVTNKYGEVYLGGYTSSTVSIATSGSYQDTLNGTRDTYLAKFDEGGNLLWSTYFGGEGSDNFYDLDCDINGNIYMLGTTGSTTGIASGNTHQMAKASGAIQDAFLVKFNPNGSPIWGTYYGGTGGETGYSCISDKSGNVYISGATSSAGSFIPNSIATPFSHQDTLGMSTDGFLAKFDSTGSRLWGSYYGGNSSDRIASLAIDLNGDVIGFGWTNSTDAISTPGAHKTAYSGQGAGFIVKFDSSGNRYWGTYFGDLLNTWVHNGLTDALGNIYIVGETNSVSGISTPGSHQQILNTTLAGRKDAFLAKFSPQGQQIWGTYLGGNDHDIAYGCSINKKGDLIMCGYSASGNDTISTPNAAQTQLSGITDAFLAKFDSSGSAYYCSYIGGPSSDESFSCATSYNGFVYLTGHTLSVSNISTPGSHQDTRSSGQDNYLMQFCDTIPDAAIIVGDTLVCTNETNLLYYIQFGNSNMNYIWSVPSGAVITSGQGTDSIYVDFGITPGSIQVIAQNTCAFSTNSSLNISLSSVMPSPILSLVGDTLCAFDTLIVTAGGGSSYLWSTGDTGTVITIFPFKDTIITVLVTDNGCDSLSDPINIVVNPLPSIVLDPFTPDTLCEFDLPVNLPNASPSGGLFTGVGVQGTKFSPGVAGLGTHDIIYSYTDSIGCEASDTTQVTVITCAIGMSELEESHIFRLYPNPNKGTFVITIIEGSTDIQRIRLFDAQSRLILDEIPMRKTKEKTINISSYSKGIYYLQLVIEDEVFNRKVIVK